MKRTIVRIIVVALVLILTTFALGATETGRTGCGTLGNILKSCNPIDPDDPVENYTREGNIVYFGSYPQTKVTNTDVIDELNVLAGALPTSYDFQDWTSYEYYISGNIADYMWYVDVELDGEKYRGVYFTEYRPYNVSYYDSSKYNNQYDHGYYKNITYWFKYEPISWTILDESEGFLLCNMMIDSQQYDRYVNNYEYSQIRDWLNDDFYNTAFSESQMEIIKTTTVDNSASSTSYEENENPFACNDTQDKVFLLSRWESVYSLLNLDSDAKRRRPTDYARSQGIFADYWSLRSPCDDSEWNSWVVFGGNGNHFQNSSVARINGIVPALCIQLD